MHLILIQNDGVLTGTFDDPSAVPDGVLAAFDANGTQKSLGSAIGSTDFFLVEGGKTPVRTGLINASQMEVSKKTYAAPVQNKITFASIPVGPSGGDNFTIKLIDLTPGFEPYGRYSVDLPVASAESAESIITRFANEFNAKTELRERGVVRSNKIQRITVAGTSGTGTITIDGDNYTVTFATNIDTSINNFVSANASTFLSRYGIALTADTVNDQLVLTASVGNFSTPTVTDAVTGDIDLTVVNTQAATDLIFEAKVGYFFTYAKDFGAATDPTVSVTPFSEGQGTYEQILAQEEKSFALWGDLYPEVAQALRDQYERRAVSGGKYTVYTIRQRLPAETARFQATDYKPDILIALESSVTGNLDTFFGL